MVVSDVAKDVMFSQKDLEFIAHCAAKCGGSAAETFLSVLEDLNHLALIDHVLLYQWEWTQWEHKQRENGLNPAAGQGDISVSAVRRCTVSRQGDRYRVRRSENLYMPSLLPLPWALLQHFPGSGLPAELPYYACRASDEGLLALAQEPGESGSAVDSVLFVFQHRHASSIAQSMGLLTSLLPGLARSARGLLTNLEQVDTDVGLSKREMEVLMWAAEGKSAWEIGKILEISQRTVNFHLQNVYRKLGVSKRSQAISKAIEAGVLPRAS